MNEPEEKFVTLKETYQQVLINESGEFEDIPKWAQGEQPEQPKTEHPNLNGWIITNNTYTTGGPDPTEHIKYSITKPGHRPGIMLSRFFDNDWEIQINGKEIKQGIQNGTAKPWGSILDHEDFVNQKLLELNAPTLDLIEQEIQARQEDYSEDDYGPPSKYM